MTHSTIDHTRIRSQLLRYIREEILRDPDCALDMDTPLITGGIIDSFSITHISVFMEKEFSAHIRDADLTIENMDTINDMARLAGNALSESEKRS
ncbi:MAG TPA: acyl carrier protein [Candidatus Aminicenantes bacterium]|nr:acyl carrier protein [Candidatus Aminicenantes bacterium]